MAAKKATKRTATIRRAAAKKAAKKTKVVGWRPKKKASKKKAKKAGNTEVAADDAPTGTKPKPKPTL